MHFQSSSERYRKARHQLAYEELFVMQSGLALLRNKEQCHKGPRWGQWRLNGSMYRNSTVLLNRRSTALH